jgi:Family of unknown function (DUF6339)
MASFSRLKELTVGVTALLDPAFRSGVGEVAFDDYILDFSREIGLGPMNAVVDEAMRRFPRDDRARSDAWLGPRLHNALRLTRHEAARRGVWLFLAVAARPDYVVWRWADYEPGDENPAGLDRFAGPDRKHALARLWWMAEVFRDGPDYGPAEKALSNQDVINNLFRMDIAHHRPTVLAAVRVLFPAGSAPLGGREANALAKAANAAATTLQFDVLALDPGLNESATQAWLDQSKDVDVVAHFDKLPAGPRDPAADPGEVQQMAVLLQALLEEAPVRGRQAGESDAVPRGEEEAAVVG